MDLEQHFLRDAAAFRRLLESVSLEGRNVLEIGAGTGAVTSLILENNPASVIAFQIEPGLCTISDPRLFLHERDGSELDPAMLDADCLVSAPPYSLVPSIGLLLETLRLEDAILLVPPSRLPLLPGFSVEAELSGSSFSPPSEGTHLLVRKGFRA